MSEPQKRVLFDPSAPELDKSLISAWQEQQPSAEARSRTLAMLGVASIAGAAVAGASAGLKGAAGGSIVPKAVGWALWIKVSTLLVVAGATTVAAVGLTHREPAPLPAVAPVATSASPAPKPKDPDAVIAPRRMDSLGTTEATSKTAPSPPHPHTARGDLDAQIALLDRARATAAAGDLVRVGQLVDEYERAYPDGAFVEEAEVLRLQALIDRGERASAERVAKRFLARYAQSPHAARVRALAKEP